LKKYRWLDFTEYALLLGAGAGTVASVATQQMLFASAPLSLLVALGLVNRQRLEQQMLKERTSIRALDKKVASDLDAVREQMAELPTPELLTGFQRSMIAQSEQAISRFSKALDHTRQQLEKQIEEIETPDLSLVYQDLMQLQDQYTYLCASLNNINAQVQQLSSVSRLEATETTVSQLKTEMMQMRVTLESLSHETKSNYMGLHDKLQHFERRLRQLPLQSNPSFLQQEIQELIKSVAEMVPWRDFLSLSASFDQLRDDHRQMRQNLFQGNANPGTLSTDEGANPAIEPDVIPLEATDSEAPPLETVENFDGVVQALNQGLLNLEQVLLAATNPAVSDEAMSPVDAAGTQQVLTQAVHGFSAQLNQLNGIIGRFESQHQSMLDQLSQLPNVLDAVAVNRQVELLQSRLDSTEDHLQAVQRSVETWLSQSPHTTQMAGEAQWILDFPISAELSEIQSHKSSSRKVLEQALLGCRKRLLLGWPWADDISLDAEMIGLFKQVLERKCALEIGWCHIDDQPTGRLLRSINQRWGDYGDQRHRMKTALNQLLPLKQAYPDLFKFKILGTKENFLVCDRTYAIVGMQSMQTQSSVFENVQLKLRTTHAPVIAQLIQRFDNPNLDPCDAMAYFNRGTTRYDLRDQPGAIADYTQVLEINPAHAVAFNNRGLAWVDLGEINNALQDFTRAIELDSQSFAAYCNRGTLRLEFNDPAGAIADLTEAMRLHPISALPYFYRGQALQNLGELTNAIADFGSAIERSPNVAWAYCYRGAVYQKQGDTRRAIADLESAARYLRLQGDVNNLNQVVRTLEKLKTTTPVRVKANQVD
jgi:Tfp pilus assembly protein PilF